jgi:hypothetical protein
MHATSYKPSRARLTPGPNVEAHLNMTLGGPSFAESHRFACIGQEGRERSGSLFSLGSTAELNTAARWFYERLGFILVVPAAPHLQMRAKPRGQLAYFRLLLRAQEMGELGRWCVTLQAAVHRNRPAFQLHSFV